LCSGAWQRHSVEKALQGKENVQAAQHKSSAAAHGTAASAAAKNIGK